MVINKKLFELIFIRCDKILPTLSYFYDRRLEHVLAQITVARAQKRLKETNVWSPIDTSLFCACIYKMKINSLSTYLQQNDLH